MLNPSKMLIYRGKKFDWGSVANLWNASPVNGTTSEERVKPVETAGSMIWFKIQSLEMSWDTFLTGQWLLR